MKDQQGFTLIELMIVVAIIAILAAIAISQYQDYVIRSQVSEGSSLADGIKTAVGEFYNNNGRFQNTGCDGNTSLGLATPASIVGSYVSLVHVHGDGCGDAGTIHVMYSGSGAQKANAAIDGKSLLFSPVTHAGSISWTCKKQSVDMKDKWLPSSCR